MENYWSPAKMKETKQKNDARSSSGACSGRGSWWCREKDKRKGDGGLAKEGRPELERDASTLVIRQEGGGGLLAMLREV